MLKFGPPLDDNEELNGEVDTGLDGLDKLAFPVFIESLPSTLRDEEERAVNRFSRSLSSGSAKGDIMVRNVTTKT